MCSLLVCREDIRAVMPTNNHVCIGGERVLCVAFHGTCCAGIPAPHPVCALPGLSRKLACCSDAHPVHEDVHACMWASMHVGLPDVKWTGLTVGGVSSSQAWPPYYVPCTFSTSLQDSGLSISRITCNTVKELRQQVKEPQQGPVETVCQACNLPAAV